MHINNSPQIRLISCTFGDTAIGYADTPCLLAYAPEAHTARNGALCLRHTPHHYFFRRDQILCHGVLIEKCHHECHENQVALREAAKNVGG